MKHNFKKIILYLGVLFAVSILISKYQEKIAYADTYGDYLYEVENNTITIYGYYGDDAKVTIPSSIKGYPVTTIGFNAFNHCNQLESITIPKSIKKIDSNGIRFCPLLASINVNSGNSNYTSVDGVLYNKKKTQLLRYAIGKKDSSFKIPDGVTLIGDEAFSNSFYLTNVTIPSSMKEIGYYSFVNCTKLTKVTMPKKLEVLGRGAFNGCNNLQSIIIPSGVKEFGFFYECPSLSKVTISETVQDIDFSAIYDEENGLKEINVNSANTKYSSLNGVLYNKAKTSLLYYPDKKSGATFVIPGMVSLIEEKAFNDCDKLESIMIPYSVVTISANAFNNCNQLKNITFPNRVEDIGSNAFNNCSKLETVSIGSSVKSNLFDVFLSCNSLKSFRVESSNKYYSASNGVLYSKDRSKLFRYPVASATTLFDIPGGVTSILDNAFDGARFLTSVTIPGSVSDIGLEAFYGCNKLQRVTLAYGLSSIDSGAFENCSSLQGITFPKSLTYIGAQAFSGCSSLKEITIPDSVTMLKSGAFMDCTSLQNIIISNNIPYIDAFTLSGCSALQSVILPGGISSIAYEAFEGCTSLKEISIPNGVTEIDERAFYGCASLKEIIIPKGVTNIERETFQDCKSLQKITLPLGVGEIGSSAFENCINLDTINLPEGLSQIGDRAFAFTKLKTVSIPKKVSELSGTIFYYCRSLQSINVDSQNANYTSVNGVVFDKNQSTLICYPDGKTESSYRIPDNIKKIEYDAFSVCSNLTSITLSKNLFDLPTTVFYECINLKEIKVDASSKYFTSDKGILYNKNKTILISYPNGKTEASLTVPSSVNSINYRAFNLCPKLQSITLSDNIQDVWNYFNHCMSLKSIVAKSTNKRYTTVDGVLFDKSKSTLICYPVARPNSTYAIPKGVKCLDYNSFRDSKYLVSVTMPNTLTTILDFAFCESKSLQKVTIPSSCNWMGVDIFYLCGRLNSVVFEGNAPAVVAASDVDDEGIFGENAPDLTVYYIYGKSGFLSTWQGVKTSPIYAAPSNLKANSSGYNSINLQWGAVSGASGYEVWRSTTANGKYTLVTTLKAVTNYKNSGLTTGKTYYYKVKAYRMEGTKKVYGRTSSVVNAKPIPAVPTNTKAVRVNATSIKITWKGASGASGYEVYGSTSKTGKYKLIQSSSSSSCLNKGLKKGKYYYYKVRSYKMVGKVKVVGNYTTIVSAKTY